jgi:FkbM family methyltransferase
VQTDVGIVWISESDEVMRPYMRRRRCWEPEEGRLLRRLLSPGASFLDIGANVGYFSLLAASVSPTIRIDAVEPMPVNLEALRFNLWENDVRAQVWPLALDSTSRSVQMSVAPTNLGDARVTQEARENEVALVVPAARGDDLFHDRRFDVVKVDVQGWELEVIDSLRSTLRSSPGVRVVVEYMPQAIRSRPADPRAVLDHYRNLGFRREVQVGDDLRDLSDDELIRLCDESGPEGLVNLLLTATW